MSLKWIGFVIFIWITLSFVAAIFDEQNSEAGTWPGETNETRLEYLLDFKQIMYSHSETGEAHFVLFSSEYFSVWKEIITWDYTFLRCPEDDPTTPDTNESRCGYAMVRWIILIPFSVTAIFGITYMFITLMQGFIRL